MNTGDLSSGKESGESKFWRENFQWGQEQKKNVFMGGGTAWVKARASESCERREKGRERERNTLISVVEKIEFSKDVMESRNQLKTWL